jgi:transcriptional regulator with XRE-family HTH domain
MSSSAERIREARERAGIDADAVASAAGLNPNWYFDVESYDAEVTSNISLDQLIIITHVVGLTPLGALEGPAAQAPAPRISLTELVETARRQMIAAGETVEQYSTRVGWEMAPLFANPAYLRNYTVDALQDICRTVGMDWRAALPVEITPPAG